MVVSRTGGTVVALALAGMFALGSQSTADTQVPLGARAIAMGGAFSAIADDVTALFWNPAGLTRIEQQEIGFAHANLFDSGIKDDYLAFALPLSQQALALDWYHSGFGDAELDFGENRFDVGYSLKLGSGLAVGLTGKYLTRHTDLDGIVVRQGNGFGLDAGLLASPWGGLTLGLVGQDLFDTRLQYDQGGSSLTFPRRARGAAAYSFRDLVTVATEVDDRLHLGTEVTPIPELALRAGLRKELHTDQAVTFAVGTGLRYGFVRFDYAYEIHPTLPATHHFGLGFGFNFNPPLIAMEQPKADALYASLHQAYVSEPFGQARITNRHNQDLAIRMRVSIPELEKAAYEYVTLLRAGETRDVSLLTVLPNQVMRQIESRPVHVRVEASYQSRRLNRTDRFTTKTVIMRPGTIDWRNGVEQAAAFVTASDPMIEELASHIARVAARGPTGTRNLDHVAAAVDALALLGVSYAPDPVTPYSKLSQGGPTLDTIRYPSETLSRRTGDCDDTTVLLAALLEAGGVPCRLVDAPGHLFLLADTGLHPRTRLALQAPDQMLVQTDVAVWVPIETTVLQRGFVDAWRLGSQSYASAARVGPVLSVDVAEAQEKYQPSEPPAKTPWAFKGFDPETLAVRLGEDARGLEQIRSEFWELKKLPEAITLSPTALSEIASVQFEAGNLGGAERTLRRALGFDSHRALALNNLAVVAVAGGMLGKARELLDQALDLEQGDPGIWLNLSVVSHLQGDSASAVRAVREGLGRAGGFVAACGLLGIAVDESSAKVDAYQSSAERASQELLGAISRVASGADTPARRAAVMYWKR